MIICKNCKKEMQCSKTGLGARWGNDHVYPGDAFKCSECGTEIISTNSQPVVDPNHNILTIQMDEQL